MEPGGYNISQGPILLPLFVPTDLKPIIGRREFFKCLRVPTYRDAKLKAAW